MSRLQVFAIQLGVALSIGIGFDAIGAPALGAAIIAVGAFKAGFEFLLGERI